jgi:hypothetical protein
MQEKQGQGPLPPRPGEHPPSQVEQGEQDGQPIDSPLQPRPAPQPETPKTM